MKKEYYLELMEKALSAYPYAHIERYFNDVKKNGLTEHGFPRLTANIGILIAHGRRKDLLPIFMEMMDFCCHTIPRVKAANDFSVKEIIFCIMELERTDVVSSDDIARWKGNLATIEAESCYNIYARSVDEKPNNWALFTALSEYMRMYAGLGGEEEFIDIQIATQLKRLDENGMYMDSKSDVHQPIVYDLVPRGLFAVMLHFGYRGKYFDEIDACLKKAGLLTLSMQSVTGEIAFGGRSNQFPHNEAHLAIVMEYEAKRYAKEGNTALAKKFKEGVERALEDVARWLDKDPIRHVKNRFATETKYGCEKYAYFDKYMITAASFLYVAYLICDESIEAADGAFVAPEVFATSHHFHKVFARCGEYGIEIDTNGSPSYDASGLGRVHRRGAPSAICLSLPCPAVPNYTIDADDAISFSLCPAVKRNGDWFFGAGEDTKYELTRLEKNDNSAFADFNCIFDDGYKVSLSHTVSDNGVEIGISGAGEIAYALPAFSFDGENYTEIEADGHTLTVRYLGWECKYTTDGKISELGKNARNRNGHYRTFYASAEKKLNIKIEIVKG